MSEERKVYCFCDQNCKFETMTKEQILAAIAQAAEKGLEFDPNAAIISKVNESNVNGNVTFWVGTEAQYNALPKKEPNCLYIITDSMRDSIINEQLQNANYFAENAYQLAISANNDCQNATRIAEDAEYAARQAAQSASNAVNVANAASMKREFSEKPDSFKCTVSGAKAKFYVLTIQFGEYCTTFTVDWISIKHLCEQNESHIAFYYLSYYDEAKGTLAPTMLQATVHSDNSVTFQAGGGTIVHVVGYY